MLCEDSSISLDTAWFSCKGTKLNSYLKSGYFQKFINSELTMSSEIIVTLFGKLYPTNSCVWTNMQQLFMTIKKNFSIVKTNVVENTDFCEKESNFNDVENLRINILKVFHVFLATLSKLNYKNRNYLFDHNTSVENNHLKYFLIQLCKEIKNLLLFVGPISAIPGIFNVRDFNCDTSKGASNFYHYYHLCLDMWFNCTAMVYVVHFLVPTNFDVIFCDFLDQSMPFLQLASFLVYELSFLAINRYKNAHVCNSFPFSCSCISEFWIILIKLLDKYNSYFEGTSFWSLYLQIIIKSLSSESVNQELSIDTFFITSSPIQIQDRIQAYFWLTLHLAPLYKYDNLGYFYEYEKAKSGYAVGKYLINSLISKSSDIGEKGLRISLSYCIEILKLWEPRGDILLPLTDFYIKKIDERFSLQGTELLYIFKDAVSWFTYINNLSNFASYRKESSFDIFLCILNLQLKFDVDNSLWRSLKGRIYSKLIPKKIKEMSEVGLQNSFSLFLIIAISGQLEVIDKICDMASVIENIANPSKQIISWKAIFVLLYICQEKKYNAEKIITLICKFFNSVSSDYTRLSKESMHKTKLMDLLSIYIVNMNELFKRNNSLNLSEYQLISAGFSDLLAAGSMTEVNYILGSILSILQRIERVTESSKIDIATNETEYIRTLQLIFHHIYPFIENIATMDAAPLVVPDIAATLTKITHTFTSLINCIPYDFHGIFMYFTCKETVNSNVSCQYLCLIFHFPNLMKELKFKVTDLDTLIIQSWIKCIICVHTNNDWMKDLTKKVLQQTEIIEIVPDVKNLNFQTEDHVCMAINFFQCIGDAFNKSNSQQQTNLAQRIQKFFKNSSLFILNKIKKEKNGPALTHVYKLTSHLVEYCSFLLHFHVTSDDILLQILDQTVYPQIIFSRDKALQSLVACSIKEYLPNFVRGLFKLDYRKDKSIEREIRDIFIYYLGVFPAPSNPLTKLVIDSVSRKPEGLTLDSYHFILEVLKSSLLSNNIEKPISVFEFYQEVFRFTPPAVKKEITNILLRCAMEIYMKQNDSLAEFLKLVIKKVFIYFKDKIPLSQSKVILIPIIQWFIHEKLQWSVVRGFNILDILVEYLPQVMSEIMPFLTKTVEMLEINRGIGEDMLLRNGLRNVAAKLQKKLTQT